jgi:hypothetical protein
MSTKQSKKDNIRKEAEDTSSYSGERISVDTTGPFSKNFGRQLLLGKIL